jgi:hypothetical protein
VHDCVGAAHLAFVFQLKLAGDAGHGRVDVADARQDERLSVNSARRSALETTSSNVEMGRRWLTPLRLSTFLSERAEKATCSTTSRTYWEFRWRPFRAQTTPPAQ